MIDLRQSQFKVAAHNSSQWLEDQGAEVAFAGRSNSGKSSALNCITERKKLARTSKTPGRTQQIVFFGIDDTRRLVDLPGYGYAKVPEQVKLHWSHMMAEYFMNRTSLKGLILTMDIRHPLKNLDRQFIDWCQQSSISIHILLTKADKLSKSKIITTLYTVRAEFKKMNNISVQAFSSKTNFGRKQAREKVRTMLTLEN